MRLILHIGTAKTGTTSLQHWFAANRELLLERGVFYPRSLGRSNHRLLSAYAIGYPSADWQKVGSRVAWAQDYEAFTKGLVRRFDEEIALSDGAAVCVISSEHLHSRLPQTVMVERVHELVTARFQDAEVWIHLRPQADVAVSLLSTRARMGQRIGADFFESVSPDNPYYNWHELVSRWAGVFGRDRIRLIPYVRVPDMTAYLSRHLGIVLEETALPEVRNRALGWRTLALLNVLSADGMAGDLIKNVRPCLERLPVGERMRLSRSDFQSIQGRFEDSNRRLVAEWPHALLATDLTPDWSKYDEEGNLDRLQSDLDFAGPLRGLLQCYQAVLDSERAEKVLLTVRLAQERGKYPEAREAAAGARALRERLAANPMHDPRRLAEIDAQFMDMQGAGGGEDAATLRMRAMRSGEGRPGAASAKGNHSPPQLLAEDAERNRTAGEMGYAEALTIIHGRLQPAFYLEIGVRRGRSLRLAQCPAAGVDPEPVLESPPALQHRIFEMTSDRFFADRAGQVLAATPPDLVLIDGMHLFEYALRDFINAERWSSTTTLIVIDDVFPNHPAQATRRRGTQVWPGDVWKLLRVLQQRRPELLLLPLNTAPTGLLLVAGLDPDSRILPGCYDDLVESYGRDGIDPDPDCLRRADAVSPSNPAFTGLLDLLRQAREAPPEARDGILAGGLKTLSSRLSATPSPAG